MAKTPTTKVRGITIEIDADLTGLTKEFKNITGQVNRLKSNIGALTKEINDNTSFSGLGRKFEDITLRHNLMEQEVERVTEKIKQEETALSKLAEQDQTPKVIEQQQALQTQIALDRAELEKLKSTLEEWGSVVHQKFDAVGDAFISFGEQAYNTGRTLNARVTQPIYRLGQQAYESAADVESAMDKVASVSLDATEEELAALREQAINLSSDSKFSATEAADALYYMGLAGYKASEMSAALPDVLNLAAAGDMDLARASDIVTDYLTAFGMSADESTRMVDVMTKTMINSNTDVDKLGESFKYVAPVAGALGYSVEDVSFALGLMANNGIKASQAGTTLRMFMQRLAKPTAEVEEAMDKLNISLEDGEGNMKPFRQILDELRASFSGSKIPMADMQAQMAELDAAFEEGSITEEEYTEGMEDLMEAAYGVKGAEKAKYGAILAGTRGMSGILAIVNTTEDEYNELSDAINGTATAQEVAAGMMDNAQGDMARMKHAIENLGISIGDTVIPYVRQFVDKIQNLVEKFRSLNPETQALIIKITGIVAAIGPALMTIGLLSEGIGGILKGIGSAIDLASKIPTAISGIVTIVQSVGTAISGVISFVMANPWMLAVAAAVAAAATVAKAVHEVSEQVKEEAEAQRQELYGLSDEHVELANKIKESYSAYQHQREERRETANSIDAEIGYYQDLIDELDRLVDENGHVREGYEDRVDFITSELSEAFDIEIDYNGKLITDYQNIQSELQGTIDKMRQEAILEAGRERYKEAIENQRTAYENYAEAASALAEQQEKVATAEEALLEYAKTFPDYNEQAVEQLKADDEAYQALLADYNLATEAEATLQTAMEQSWEVYADSIRQQKLYSDAVRATAHGTSKEAEEALDKLLYDFKTYDTSTREQLQSQLDYYSELYEQSQKDIENGVAGVTQATVDGYRDMADLAQKELNRYDGIVDTASDKAVDSVESAADKIRAVDFAGPGSENMDDYVEGVERRRSNVTGATTDVAQQAAQGARQVDYRGPGSDNMQNYATGISSGKKSVSDAVSNVVSTAEGIMSGASAISSGADFVAGFVNGINNNKWRISEAVGGMANTASKTLNNKLLIKSPSRVTEKSGGFFDEGFVVGVEKNTKGVISSVEALSEDVVAAFAPRPEMDVGYSGIAAGNNTRAVSSWINNITINQQPGEDAEALTDRVMDRLYREIYQRQAVVGL